MNWKLINFCEYDQYAIKSYCAIHNMDESLNLGDITKVNEKEIADFDLMTWGFPCTDISVAGKQTGFIDENGNKTRSGMYYEGIRILKEKKPKISIIENVKNLTSKKFKKEFETVLSDLMECGYNNYWKVLNAKNYGVPQNRERVFIVSIRKDIDNWKFRFPQGFDNGIRLKDILEDEVDEKYYISNDKAQKLISQLSDKIKGRQAVDGTINEPQIKEIANCIKARYDAGISNLKSDGTMVIEPTVQQIGNIVDTGNWNNPQRGRIYSAEGISPSLNTVGGGGLEPKVIVVGNTSNTGHNGENVVSQDGISPTLKARDFKGPVQVAIPVLTPDREEKRQNGRRFKEDGEPMFTLTAQDRHGILVIDDMYANREPREYTENAPTLRADRQGLKVKNEFRIRKLTPKECFRLMGFSDEDIEKAQNVGISNSQLYKQAGNSIVVDVPYYIFKELYKAIPEVFEDLKVSSFFSGIGAFEKALDKLYIQII